MRCETSFFSFTLYKKHLKRNWPLWAAHLALWLMVLPMQLWNESLHDRTHLRSFAAGQAVGAMNVLFPWLAFVAALVAVVVFFHLFKSNAANFVGALPLRREGVFLTAFAAGYTMLAGPLVVVTLVTVALEAVLGVLTPEILVFLGAGLLNSFFWLGFASLCCVISGHAVAAVAFYFIFNWIVPVMTILVEGLLQGFLYGFAGFGESFYEVAGWLCPVTQLLTHNWESPLGFDDWNMLAIYAAVGFLMALCAVGLHHIRKAERSGDLIVFVPIKWLFKICVTLCGGVGFGTAFTFIIFNTVDLNDGWKFAVCCAVAAFLCYMVSEMLLAKSFKVWKRWKGAAVSAVAFLLVVAAVDMDWIGFTTRVPNPASVKTATATFSGSGLNSVANNGLVFSGADVKAITDLHQALVDQRDAEENGDNYYYLNLSLKYKLGWSSMEREYRVRYNQGSGVGQLLNAALAAGDPVFPTAWGTPTSCSFDLMVPATGNDDNEYIGGEIAPEDLKALWTAVTADVQAGRYLLQATDPDKEVQYNTGTLYAWWFHSGTDRQADSYAMRLSPDLTATWSVLEGLGYLDRGQTSGVGTEIVD